MKMNLSEFIDELKASKDRLDWQMVNGRIRGTNRNGTCHCPITAVLSIKQKKKYDYYEAAFLGPRLGLTKQNTNKIITAADNYGPFIESAEVRLRSRMKKALGL
jgi:hypothetical protein